MLLAGFVHFTSVTCLVQIDDFYSILIPDKKKLSILILRAKMEAGSAPGDYHTNRKKQRRTRFHPPPFMKKEPQHSHQLFVLLLILHTLIPLVDYSIQTFVSV